MKSLKKQIDPLVRLLDDPEPEIFGNVKDRLLSLGNDAVPHLMKGWEETENGLVQDRIEKIIHQIQFDALKADLKIWTLNESSDLLKGAILAARFQYPELDENKILKAVERIKKDVWLELKDDLTALERVKILNHIFFDVHGFGGNTLNYHDPSNSFINNVLETKKGNPLTLSLLYSVIAQDLHIPIYGVNLPEHFILAYLGEDEPITLEGTKIKNPGTRILFYINAFSLGTVFSHKEIDSFLKQLKIEPRKYYYEPCTNAEIIQRMFRNLNYSFKKQGKEEKMSELDQLIATLD